MLTSSDWNNLNSTPILNRLGDTVLRPTELGYYDLLDADVRRRQGELARQYGIDGFIYHHYWFYHMLLGPSLNGPLDRMLEDGYPDTSFALNWAQETWTNTWSGTYRHNSDIFNNPQVLVAQYHPPNSNSKMIAEHYQYLRKFFHHRNYIKVNGAPLFTIYGHNNMQKHIVLVREALRALALEDGFPAPGLHIPGFIPMVNHMLYQHPLGKKNHANFNMGKFNRPINDAVLFYPLILNAKMPMKLPLGCLDNVEQGSDTYPWKERIPKPTYVGVMTTYDNSPRRDISTAKIGNRKHYPDSLGGPPKSFQHDVVEALVYDKCCQSPKMRDAGGKFMVINAFNEWGEGMVLEPSNVYGRKMLQAVFDAKAAAHAIGCDARRLVAYRDLHKYLNFNISDETLDNGDPRKID